VGGRIFDDNAKLILYIVIRLWYIRNEISYFLVSAILKYIPTHFWIRILFLLFLRHNNNKNLTVGPARGRAAGGWTGGGRVKSELSAAGGDKRTFARGGCAGGVAAYILCTPSDETQWNSPARTRALVFYCIRWVHNTSE